MLEELQLNHEYDVTITKQDHFGQGLVKVNNMLVFVKNALPEEVCKIEIMDIKKAFATARIGKMIVASKFRVEPNCPYYAVCGGCHIMHEEYSKQLEFKEQKIKELLERFAGLKDVCFYPIVGDKPFYYRNKVVFHGKENQLGFYQEKTNHLVPVKTCVITEKPLNKIYHEIQKFLLEHPSNTIEHLMIRKTSLHQILVDIEGTIALTELLPYLEEATTIYCNHQLVKGNPFVEESILGIQFKIYPSSFFQVNYEMMLVLYRIIMNFYQNKEYHKVLDLYCGTGTIGILVSSYVEQVIGVEKESASIIAANSCKDINRISNITFIEGKVEDQIDSFQDVDSIIVDPPRSGLDHHTLEIILNLQPATITYISCDPVTLARDLKTLVADYEVLEVHPVDMFPNTYHVETVVFLERKRKEMFQNYTILVNRNHIYQPSDFKDMVFTKTTDIEGKEILVEEETYRHYLAFKEYLHQTGIEVSITSGYRSLEEQKKTIEELKNVYTDESKLYEKVAPVGASEHHTGLALDITISNPKQYQERLTKYYTEEELKIREQQYQWMASVWSKEGFSLRYPKDKIEITGYSYEPWHFRYVGKKVAKIIMDNHLTLEEYLGTQ